jgi:hypothetical protein
MSIALKTRQSVAARLAALLAVLVAALIALVIAASAWNAAHQTVSPAPPTQAVVAATPNNLSPDSQERNAEILAGRLGQSEAHHGH